jgi:hypothetical protein
MSISRSTHGIYRVLEESPLGRRRFNFKVGSREVMAQGLDSSGSGGRPVAGSCNDGIERSGSIQGGELPDQLSNLQVPKLHEAS